MVKTSWSAVSHDETGLIFAFNFTSRTTLLGAFGFLLQNVQVSEEVEQYFGEKKDERFFKEREDVISRSVSPS